MNFKKRVNGSWTDVPHYISGTDTETITTLPATIYPLAHSMTIGLKGNTVQNGTPTPDNPVPVIGVGDLDNGHYKIPISSASTTTYIYLGEVQSTRKIKKLVLTGQENWNKSNTYPGSFYGSIGSNCLSQYQGYCTHAVAVPVPGQYNYGKMILTGDRTVTVNLWVGQPDWTLNDFKTYLAAQYAAGTPVCVWYVLATEETAVVNEPLMKIGDYADSISGISVTTTAGANTLDVLTTVQPSEVTVNYNGWHPVSSAHERSGGAWN